MTDLHNRLVSTIDSFLRIAHEPRDSPIVQDFASNWQSLYTDTMTTHSAGLLKNETADLAYRVAVLCDSLMGLSVAEGEVAQRAEEGHQAVKAQLLSQQAVPTEVRARSPTASLSPPSSPEISPIGLSSSRPPTPRRSLSVSPLPAQTSTTQAGQDQASATSPRASIPPLSVTAQGISSGLPSPAISEDNAEWRTSIRSVQSVGGDAADHIAVTIEDQRSASAEEKGSPTVVTETNEAEPSLISPPATPPRSPSVDSQNHTEFLSPPTEKDRQPSSTTPAYVLPLLTRLVEKPYNLYPSKTLISEIALSSATSEKDINAYLSQLRWRLGWNGIRKKYFPPAHWSITQMLAWLDGYWEYTHSEMPSLKDYDIYMGATGIGGTMRGLDVRLTILHDGLKGIYDRMTGREGEGSDVGKAIKEGVKWSSKHEWETKRKELEKQGEASRKAQKEEERSLKRKFVEDEDYDGEEAARQIPRARVVSAPQLQSKKRGRSESPESEDDGDLTPPPPAKRHCSLPTMSLSTPSNLENWFKVQTPMPTWDAPVTLKAFSYDAMPMPSLVDDDSDSERGSSVGPSTPDSSEYVDLPAFDFSTLVQPVEYGGMPKPFELNVHTLPDVAFPELLNAQSVNIDLFTAAPPSGKDLPSSDQFISIPTSDEAPFDFGDPQSWSFNYDGLDLGSMGFDLNFGVDGV